MRNVRNYGKYSDSLRMQIVHRYYTTNVSFRSLEREFGVSYATIRIWVQKDKQYYLSEQDIKQEIATFASVNNHTDTMPQKKLTPQQMEERIKELENQLEFERMKATTYDTMINVAEDMFKIPIRKKPGAKQFKK